MGNFEAPPPSCELYRVLDEAGARPVRQLIACASFDEYLDLAKSRFTLSLSHLGDGAAASMEERFGIASMRWHAVYDVAEVGRRYAALFEALEVTDDARARIDATLLACRQAAESAHDAARRAVGDLPVVVDSSASLMPFSLALALLETGFNVAAVFGLHLKGCDDGAEARLLRVSQVVVRREATRRLGVRVLARLPGDPDPTRPFCCMRSATVDLYHDEGSSGTRVSSVWRARWSIPCRGCRVRRGGEGVMAKLSLYLPPFAGRLFGGVLQLFPGSILS